jgi:hypothetical protein
MTTWLVASSSRLLSTFVLLAVTLSRRVRQAEEQAERLRAASAGL